MRLHSNTRADSQRKKLYRAENRHSLYSDAYLTPEQVISYAHSVIDTVRLRDPMLAARNGFMHHYPMVKILRGSGRCFARDLDRSINMRPWGFRRIIIIHELAHLIAGCHHKHHAEFARVYVLLVRICVGDAEADELARLFNEGRVAHVADVVVQRQLWRKAASEKPKLKPREKFLNTKLNELMFDINKLAGLKRNDIKYDDIERLINSYRIVSPSVDRLDDEMPSNVLNAIVRNTEVTSTDE